MIAGMRALRSEASRGLVACILVAAVLAAVSCGEGERQELGGSPQSGDQGAPRTLKIAAIMSRQLIGDAPIEGMKVAADLINSAGGINGKYRIEIVEFESEGREERAASLYRQAATDSSVIGAHILATGGLGARQVSDEVGLPLIVAGGVEAIDVPVKKFVFANAPTGELSAAAVNYVKEKFNAQSIAVLHLDTEYSLNTIEAAIRKRASELGVRITRVEQFSLNSSDATPQMVNLRNTNPDAYYIESLNPIGIVNARTLGIDKPIVTEQWLSNPAVARACGRACEGVVWVSHKCIVWEQLPDNDPVKSGCRTLVTNYQRMFPGKEFPLFAVYGYDAVNTFAEAVKRLDGKGQPITRENIAKELESFNADFRTLHGTIRTSSNDHRLIGDFKEGFIFMTVREGKYSVVQPVTHNAPKFLPTS